MIELIPYIELAAQLAKLAAYLLLIRRVTKGDGARKRP